MVKSLVFVVALARGGCDQTPATPTAGSGSGGAVASAAGSAETKLGNTTLSPEARGQLDKLTGAPPNAPVKAENAPPAKTAAKPSSTKPTLKPKPKWENYFPEYGPRKGAELMQIPDFEYDKDRWDYLSIRKSGATTYYGSIYVEYRCDDKDGCERNTSYWKAIAWYLNG